jgi:hypothetical protein
VLVIVVNLSRKKAYRASKRVVAAVLPQITIRLNIGSVPQRVLIQLVKALRESANRGTCLKIFFEDRLGYHGVKCLEIGKTGNWLKRFVYCESSIDERLRLEGLLPKLPLKSDEPKKDKEKQEVSGNEKI